VLVDAKTTVGDNTKPPSNTNGTSNTDIRLVDARTQRATSTQHPIRIQTATTDNVTPINEASGI
jgi:uncharacterized protein (UPF0218 family)